MAKGESGRIVIEIDTGLKRQLYSALALDGSTLKDWFIDAASSYVSSRDASKSVASVSPEEKPKRRKP